MGKSFARCLTVWITGGLIAWAATPVFAGGGPENLFLLVNANSDASKTIANEYIALRKIPASNVLYLDWRGGLERCDIDQFRREILSPALKAIRSRDLEDQIDYLVYSSDFPWSIDVRADHEGKSLSKIYTPVVSLTSATYLWQFALSRQSMLGLANNLYFQAAKPGDQTVASASFPRDYALPPREGVPPLRVSYYLSTMLAVTSGRGNTVNEAVASLRRSVAADATRPKGTIYFLKNSNVRSTTRAGEFGATVDQIRELGVKAEVVEGALPLRRIDVQGATIGASDFDWARSQSTLLPGAIGDNLTSFGGDLSTGAGQTPLTEFLRHGAAGASGTVVEPYAIAQKFPRPALHLHYARGCSLAESFYQAVAGPFHLLIVGDPLCQPWAVAPKVTLPDLSADRTLRGVVTLQPTAQIAEGREIERFEFFVDGRRVARRESGEAWRLDSRDWPDGEHELRVVAIEASPIHCQGRLILPVRFDNHGRQATLECQVPRPLTTRDTLTFTLFSPGATAIELRQNSRKLGEVQGERGTLDLPVALLGQGPVTLTARAIAPHSVESAPLQLTVE